ncbi:MAG: hypothetical protein V4610_25240 [Pseudomonadota bacterium]
MKLIDLADHDRASFQVLLAVSDIVTGGFSPPPACAAKILSSDDSGW